MSATDLAQLEHVIEAAFDNRDTVTTATKGEIRDAVETALNLDPRSPDDPARTDASRGPRNGPAAPAIPREATIEQVQAAKRAGYDYLKVVLVATPNGPELDTLAAVQPHTNGAGQGLECSLLQHTAILPAHPRPRRS